MRMWVGLALAGAMLAALPADAATYVANRMVGIGTVDLSITTDGTTGVLRTSNVTDWRITLTRGGESFTLLGPNSGANSQLLILGDELTATPTDLSFNFSGADSIALFQNPNIGSGINYYCVETSGCSTYPNESFALSDGARADQSNLLSGNRVIASVAAAPEPASWAMMIGGFGLAGGALRRSRRLRASSVEASIA